MDNIEQENFRLKEQLFEEKAKPVMFGNSIFENGFITGIIAVAFVMVIGPDLITAIVGHSASRGVSMLAFVILMIVVGVLTIVINEKLNNAVLKSKLEKCRKNFQDNKALYESIVGKPYEESAYYEYWNKWLYGDNQITRIGRKKH